VSSSVAPAPVVLHLSLVVGGEPRDEARARLGRVEDLIVRLGQPGYPPTSGVLATVADRRSYVPAERIATIEHDAVTLDVAKLDYGRSSSPAGHYQSRVGHLFHHIIAISGSVPRSRSTSAMRAAMSPGAWAMRSASAGFFHIEVASAAVQMAFVRPGSRSLPTSSSDASV
jgi:hypothetical protein